MLANLRNVVAGALAVAATGSLVAESATSRSVAVTAAGAGIGRAIALRFAAEVDCGSIQVNSSPLWRSDPMPYGGVKKSGIGREGARFAVEEMTEPRLLVLRGA